MLRTPTPISGTRGGVAGEDVPVEVEDRLPGSRADIDDDAIVLEPFGGGHLGDEAQHARRLLVGEGGDVAERIDVPLREHQQVRLGSGGDVADRHEPVGRVEVVTLGDEAAEEAVRRQPPAPPRRRRRSPRARSSSPTAPATSHGV